MLGIAGKGCGVARYGTGGGVKPASMLEELIAALIDSERNPKQIRLVIEHAYKIGVNDGARLVMEEVAKNLGQAKEAAKKENAA